MLTLNEFKERYKIELEGLSEEVSHYYRMYLEDPFQFNPDMIG